MPGRLRLTRLPVMRIGLALPHYDTTLAGGPLSWEGVRRVARLAEQAGYDSVWVSDHLFLDYAKYGGDPRQLGALECFTTLAAVAAATRSVRLGSLVACNDLRNPALLAKMAATLALLSEDRLDLGMGAGWYEPEYRAAGLAYEPPGRRIDRLGEAVTIVRRLLEGEEVTFSGAHYALDGAVCRPVPARRPPVFVGGKGDRLIATAAAHADGWNFSWLGSVDAYLDRARVADRACECIGRDPTTLARSVGAYVIAGRDDADARRRFERLASRTDPGVIRDPDGGGEVSWERFRRDHVAGTVAEVTDTLGRLAEAGVDEVVVTVGTVPFQVADEDDVELIGAEIAPVLR